MQTIQFCRTQEQSEGGAIFKQRGFPANHAARFAAPPDSFPVRMAVAHQANIMCAHSWAGAGAGCPRLQGRRRDRGAALASAASLRAWLLHVRRSESARRFYDTAMALRWMPLNFPQATSTVVQALNLKFVPSLRRLPMSVTADIHIMWELRVLTMTANGCKYTPHVKAFQLEYSCNATVLKWAIHAIAYCKFNHCQNIPSKQIMMIMTTITIMNVIHDNTKNSK
jgi:hypothetical protein